MIKFKTIKWKNFLSTGNYFNEINFEKYHTNLIIGNNGSGKSTVLDALTFVLFNKPFRKINKPQLINSINNKDTIVEVEFSVGSKNYLVRRGIKPNIFDIVVNGKVLDKQADDKVNQKILEENILKFNYKSFTQIVILGSSTFVPFMQLSSTHRREVIDDLLDIKVLSSMNVLAKDKIKLLKEEIKNFSSSKETTVNKIDLQKDFIEKLKELDDNTTNESNKNIEELETKITKLNSSNKKNSVAIKKLQDAQKDLIDYKINLKNYRTDKGKLTQKASHIKNTYTFFNTNTVCPTCTQTIDEKTRLNKVEEIQEDAKSIQAEYEKLEKLISLEEEKEKKFSLLSDKLSTLNNEVFQNNTEISFCQKQIKNFQLKIQTVANQIQNRNIEYDKLKNYEEELKTIESSLEEKYLELKRYEFVVTLLKDDGIKTKIIKKYLPIINQSVNKYLQMMDFYVNFNLDEEFNETVNSPIYEDFSYTSFSEGEKARIDLSLILSWREVAKLKNSLSTNIILFDEVFDSSLDGFGSDELLKIIKYVVKDANIFVISHKEGLEDRFDNVIKYEKKKGFSYKKEQRVK
jgi:DNA repair exonuclease SbcCD ATPase subunit